MKYWIAFAVILIVFLLFEVLFRGLTKTGVTLVYWLLAPKRKENDSNETEAKDSE